MFLSRKRSPLTFYKPIGRLIVSSAVICIIGMAIGAIVTFGVFAPPGWHSLSFVERLRSTVDISLTILRNVLIDPFLPSMLNSRPGFDAIHWISENSYGMDFYGRWGVALAAGLAAAIPMTMALQIITPYRRKAHHVEGPRLIFGINAIIKARHAVSHVLTGQETIELSPGLPLPREREIRSFLVLGAQRSGKTVFLRYILRQLMQTDARIIVHDTKGDFTQCWPTNDFILLAPHDARSWGWDIGHDVRGELMTFEFAAALVPEANVKEPIWVQGAQQILCGILIALQHQYGTEWGWRELRDALQQQPEALEAMIARYYPQASQFLSRDPNGEFTRTAASYVNSLIAPVARLVRPLAAAWGDLHPGYRLSLRDWLADDYRGPRHLILQRMPSFPEMSRLWISAAISHMVSITGGADFPDSSTRKIWFCLDEFPQLARIDGLFNIPATHAAKGIALALTFQSLGQAKQVYGPEAPQLLSGLTGTKVIFKIQPGEDADYVSKTLIGPWRYSAPERERPAVPNGWIQLFSKWRDHSGDLVLPSYFGWLGPKKNGVEGLVLGLDDVNVYRLNWAYEDWPTQRLANIQAKWVLEIPEPSAVLAPPRRQRYDPEANSGGMTVLAGRVLQRPATKG
jgi:hypothetical protein